MNFPLFRAALCLGAAFQIGACSNEIDVIGEWKEIPIVYGIIDLDNDTVSYIRVEKAYLPPDRSAYEVAQIADSLYYNPADIDVLLYENGVLRDTLDRVDLNLLGYVKEQGIFASDVNYAYRTYYNFQPGRTYKLEIRNRVTGNIFSAETKAINGDNNFAITNPPTSKPVDWSSYNNIGQRYEFKTVLVNWREAADAGTYDMRIVFHYAEFEVDLSSSNEPEIPGTRECKTLEWANTLNYNTMDNPPAGGIVRVDVDGQRFYEYVAQRLTPATGTNKRRCAVKIDFIVDGAGTDLAEYIKSQTANQNLIGGLYPVDPYTNIKGGFGIFSTKLRRQRLNMNLDADNAEYLSAGDITRDLGFRNTLCPCQ